MASKPSSLVTPTAERRTREAGSSLHSTGASSPRPVACTSVDGVSALSIANEAVLAARPELWIVEDSPLQLAELRRLLVAYDQECFSSAEEMIERLSRKRAPALVLMDLHLGGISGLEASRFLRTLYDEVTLPILILTTSTTPGELTDALSAGANDFIAKPYVPAEVVARVRSLVRVGQQARTLAVREAWLESSLASISDAILLGDTTAGVTFMNGAAEVLTGWSVKDARGRRLDEVARLFDGDVRSPVENPGAVALAQGQTIRPPRDAFLLRPDGTEVPVEGSASPIRAPSGEVAGVALVLRDQTSRRRQEHAREQLLVREQDALTKAREDGRRLQSLFDQLEALASRLHESEERLRQVVEAAGVGLWDLDASAGAIRSDPRTVELLGLPREAEVTLDSALAVIPSGDRERVAAAVEAALRGEDEGRYRLEFRTGGRDGVPMRWVESRAQASFDAGGKGAHLAGAIMDITERKAAEASARIQSEFEQHLIGIVSHDLRNPLQAIQLAATLLVRREDADERTLRLGVRIQGAAERATRFVGDLLDFTQARIGGGLPVHVRRCDLHELTQAIVDEVEATHANRTVRFLHAGDGVGEWDPDRITQVIQNLLTNALKYSAAETAIDVSTWGDGEDVGISVHNLGPPILDELRVRLFEPFQRGSFDADAKARSIGLGLYIVKKVVDAHGGTIEVHSAAGEGTTFTVGLPRRR